VHEFEATPEQQAIIEAELKSIAVVACPGSGKTATAVRRVAEVRRRLEEMGSRGHVALLSFSNVAVDTFRDEYRMRLLRPHGARHQATGYRTPDHGLGCPCVRAWGSTSNSGNFSWILSTSGNTDAQNGHPAP
jgi:superfamily I DNA/RNA helicase